MNSQGNPYDAAGLSSSQSEKIKECLAKARSAIKDLANRHSSDEEKFKKEQAIAHDETMKEIEKILGKDKANEFVRHLLSSIQEGSVK